MKISVASRWLASLAVAALSFSGSLQAQTPATAPLKEVVFPVLAKSGADVNAFIPRDWQLDAKTTGDLNGDGKPDLLFVLINNAPNLGVKGVGVLPRIIAVAFANADGHGYTLAMQNSTLLTIPVEPTSIDMMDGLDSCSQTPAPAKCDGILKIARGAFQVYIQNWVTSRGGETFTFRFQHGGIELIGFTSVGTTYETIETDDVNYSTGRMVITVQKISSDGPGKSTTKTLPQKPLLNIQTMGNVQDFTEPIV